jgi:hypothetical protein
MSVRQLLYEAADPDAYLDEIEAAIRKAVIREASIGKKKSAYETMDVEQLLSILVDAPPWKRVQLHPIIRRGAIEEASVGEVEVRVHESGDELGNDVVTASEQFICQTWIPAGTYLLVPKEEK